MTPKSRSRSFHPGAAPKSLCSRTTSYVTVDASARVKFSNDRFELAVIGKNLTNKQYFLGAHADGPLTGSDTGTPAGISADQIGFGTVPRTVMVQATFQF